MTPNMSTIKIANTDQVETLAHVLLPSVPIPCSTKTTTDTENIKIDHTKRVGGRLSKIAWPYSPR